MSRKHRKFHKSLIRLFSVSTFVLVPITIIAIILLTFLFSAAKKDMAAGAEQEARLIAVQESRVFAGIRNTLLGISQFSEVKAGNRRDCDKTLALLLDHINVPEKQFLNIGVADMNGNVICNALPFSGTINIADRDYFKRAVSTRDFSFGNYQVGRVTRQETVNLAYPTIDETGGVRYVFFVALDLKALNEMVGKFVGKDVSDNTSLTVTDEDYNVLVRYPAAFYLVGKTYGRKDVIENSKNEGSAEIIDVDGVPRIVGFSTIRTPSGLGHLNVIVGVPAYDFNYFVPGISDWVWIFVVLLFLAVSAGWYAGGKTINHFEAEE